MIYVVYTPDERFQARMIILDMVEGKPSEDPKLDYTMPNLSGEQDIAFRSNLGTAFQKLWNVPFVVIVDEREFITKYTHHE